MLQMHMSILQLRTVSEQMDQLSKDSVYQYPWATLERDLENRALSGLPLVAYGSLINIESAIITFSAQSCSKYRPVISFGMRRLFNYKLPMDNPRYKEIEGLSCGALNINATNKIDDIINGILFEIPIRELDACRNREIGYDLLPVVTINWNEKEEPPFIAYILQCPDDPTKEKSLLSDDIYPNKHYYLTCRNGARAVSDYFLNFWLATTYLADGITPVSKWETAKFPGIISPRKNNQILADQSVYLVNKLCSKYFESFTKKVEPNKRNIGLELEFQLVDEKGKPADLEIVVSLFDHLKSRYDWKPMISCGIYHGIKNPDRYETLSFESGRVCIEYSSPFFPDLISLEKEIVDKLENIIFFLEDRSYFPGMQGHILTIDNSII